MPGANVYLVLRSVGEARIYPTIEHSVPYPVPA